MVKGPNSEELVEKCYRERPDQLTFTHANRNSQLDADGTDFLLDFKIKCNKSGRRVYFPLTMRLQIKTSDGETIGMVLPLPDPVPSQLQSKMTKRMQEIIEEHSRKHPHVNCILFVARPKGKTDEQIPADIWRETKKLLYVIKRHYFQKV